jgi:hypothetical protein
MGLVAGSAETRAVNAVMGKRLFTAGNNILDLYRMSCYSVVKDVEPEKMVIVECLRTKDRRMNPRFVVEYILVAGICSAARVPILVLLQSSALSRKVARASI